MYPRPIPTCPLPRVSVGQHILTVRPVTEPQRHLYVPVTPYSVGLQKEQFDHRREEGKRFSLSAFIHANQRLMTNPHCEISQYDRARASLLCCGRCHRSHIRRGCCRLLRLWERRPGVRITHTGTEVKVATSFAISYQTLKVSYNRIYNKLPVRELKMTPTFSRKSVYLQKNTAIAVIAYI